MKSILLTSTAIVAFAGAAVADGHAANDGVSFGGSAGLEFNSETGFSSSAELNTTMTRALDNGLTASAAFTVDIEDGSTADGTTGSVDLSSSSYVLKLASETASLSYGSVDPVAAAAWSGVDGSVFDGFDEVSDSDAVLAGSATFGETTVAVSHDVDIAGGKLDQMQAAVTSTFGAASVALVYQDATTDGVDGTDADFTAGELLGLSVGTSAAGADVKLAYLTDMTDNSFGVDVSYPAGPVTLGAYYTANSAADDAWGVRADYDNGNGITAGVTYENDESWEVTAGYAMGAVAVSAAFDSDDDFSLEGSYEAGNGVTVFAGVADAGDDSYIGASYAMGGGATATISFAEDKAGDNADNEIGTKEYAKGATVGLSFEF